MPPRQWSPRLGGHRRGNLDRDHAGRAFGHLRDWIGRRPRTWSGWCKSWSIRTKRVTRRERTFFARSKLPRARVDALVNSGDGDRFDAGKGRPMAEWFALSPTSSKRWLGLSEEEMAFVERG
jgi:hypothetical protein